MVIQEKLKSSNIRFRPKRGTDISVAQDYFLRFEAQPLVIVSRVHKYQASLLENHISTVSH